MMLVHRRLLGHALASLLERVHAAPLLRARVGWTKVFGAGPLGFRSFSALAGTLTIPVLYLRGPADLAAGRPVGGRAGGRQPRDVLLLAGGARLRAADPVLCGGVRLLATCVTGAGRASPGAVGAASRCSRCSRTTSPPSCSCPRRSCWSGASAGAACGRRSASSCSPGSRSRRWRSASAPTARPAGSKTASLGSRAGETVKQFLVGLYGPLEILTACSPGCWRRGGRAVAAHAASGASAAARGMRRSSAPQPLRCRCCWR